VVSDDIILKFWAKKKAGSDIYPLLHHMIDTVAVTQELWDKALHASARSLTSREIGLSDTEARRLVAFWTGLHDIGKASPGFQCQDEVTRQELHKLGFSTAGKDPGHGVVTARLLRSYLNDSLGPDFAYKIATTLGGHHGVFPRSDEVNQAQSGTGRWPDGQKRLFEVFRHLCGGDSSLSPAFNPSPAFFMFLAGLTSVADWIASNETFFPYKVEHYIQEHLFYARKQAILALDELGWSGWQPPPAPSQIQLLFPTIIKEVRPLQQEAIAIASTLTEQPGLVIIEAPMGEGKTEAAMYLADSWMANLKQKGCYFALPTMATSDQMFSRVKDFLDRRYHNDRVNLMLLHGHAALSAEFESLKNKEAAFNVRGLHGEEGYDGASAGVVASEWFTYRKRGLLAPFGVGTVDQVLLAVLQTRHVFVRLFGLANKTVIIDEIHAYDAYMTTLLERLLEWLAALGSAVVMLSATLPKERRTALLRAYAKASNKCEGGIPVQTAEVKYPRISWTSGGEFNARTIATSNQPIRKLNLQWVDGNLPTDDGPFELGRKLQETLSAGGSAAIICNTVDRAQRVYLALKPCFGETDAGDGYPELNLLHARYLFGDRKKREERTLLRFGKPHGNVRCEDGIERRAHRPRRAVLVATQIIEQSLDLDFDLMITEMAPVDLLLQRAGRLHRHTRERPENLKEPLLWICQPAMNDGIPDFGDGTKAVYDHHVLLRSWLAVKDRATIRIPNEVEDLIEEVYGERECAAREAEEMKKKWEESLAKLKIGQNKYESKAKSNRILPPNCDAETLLETFNRNLEEDNPSIHETLQALTRLSEEPSVSVICLSGTNENPSVSHEAVDTKNCPDNDTTRKLLEHSVRISRRGLVPKIVREGVPIPEEWHKKPQLRHHFLLFFGDKGTCSVGDYVLKLDKELGLTIHRKEG
jgi:CRISPR-associated endonuclease/helicase Cas3